MSSSPWKPKVTGWLYVAELGTEKPDMTVEDGVFASAWAKPWVRAGTVYEKPVTFTEDRRHEPVGFGEVGYRSPPSYRLVLPREADLSEWPARHRPAPLYSPPSIYEVKFMVGWESVGHVERAVCPQVLPIVWPTDFRLERADRDPSAFTMYFATPQKDLLSWLSAQLDEDVIDAADWHTRSCAVGNYRGFTEGCDCGGPARALREVAAKRRIVARHSPRAAGPPNMWVTPPCGWPSLDPCPDLGDLLSIYSDRPGFDPSWVAG